MPSSLVSRMSGFATVLPSMMRHISRSLPGQACISGADAALGARRKTSQTLASHRARLAWGDAPGARLARIPNCFARPEDPGCRFILDAATMEDPILEFLRSQARNYRCRVCGSNHKGSQLRKIGNHNNKLIVQVTCGRCRDSFFLHIEFAGSIVNAVEEVTRVAAPSPRDTDEIEGEPLTHDDVLDAHQRLAAFQGKLTELLED